MIELARWFSKQPQQQRGILFMTFAGEELGLLGSNYYTGHPLLPLENAVTMINMDMIGRIRGGKVYVNGTGTGSTLDKLVESVKPPESFKLDLSEATGYGGSDHMSFTVKQVPVLFFFSGLHGDYHKPSDTWDKIDAPDAAKLLGYVAQIATRLANDPERPKFQRVAEEVAPGQLRRRQRIWSQLRQHPRFRRAAEWRPLRRYSRRNTRGQSRSQGGRYPDRVRRQGHREFVRLHLCPTGPQAW